MRKRTFLRQCGVLLTAILAAFSLLALQTGFGASPAISAAPATVYGPPKIASKATLNETSIDGPSLWTTTTGEVRAIIAWTGTDTYHHLNVMTSANGVTFGNKVILSETSPYRPAVASWGGETGTRIDIAWMGTDTKHSVNVRLGVAASGYNKLTLPEYTFTAPALAVFNGDLFLAWAGTDTNHSLNVIQIIPRGGILTQNKVTLWQDHSLSRPSLATDPNGNHLILSWTGPDHRIRYAVSDNGKTWSAARTLNEWSDVGASMMGVPMTNMPRHWLAWRGTDSAHSLNVQYTESYPSWPIAGTKTTFALSTLGGPALGFIGVNRQTLVAWTSLGTPHRLIIAKVGV